jgi:alcohol dehydrogenase/S-(hydroxymethyl)glutathione dehydrogenase/alcohol dehydrogenase
MTSLIDARKVDPSMRTEAALLDGPNGTIRVVDLELEPPRAGEVMVEIAATGVCHSDLSVLDGSLDNPMPIVLGHEGAGIVVQVGEGVTDVAVGDHVVLVWLAQCGACFYCVHGQHELCERAGLSFARSNLPDGTTRLSHDGRPVFQMAGLGTFSRHCVVPAGSVVKIPPDLPFESAALIGCAALTGFGAAVNTADIRVGDSVAVVGGGGVGLNAIQGARTSGAARIIVVDPNSERRDCAISLGATDALAPSDTLVREVRGLTEGRGVDVSFEVVGHADTIAAAVKIARRGGQIVLVGAARADVMLSVPAFNGIVMTGKKILGSLYGSANVRRDVPRLVDLYRSGALQLDELVTERFALDQITDAVAYCAAGLGIRGVVVMK